VAGQLDVGVPGLGPGCLMLGPWAAPPLSPASRSGSDAILMAAGGLESSERASGMVNAAVWTVRAAGGPDRGPLTAVARGGPWTPTWRLPGELG